MASISFLGQVPAAYPPIGAEVFVKRAWADEWTWIPFVKVLECEAAGMPTVGTARLRYRFGLISRAELLQYSYYLPLLVQGALVKIVVYCPWAAAPLWFGRLEVESVEPFGTVGFPSGVQTLTAYSLEHDIDRTPIAFSKTESGWVDRAITFNERRRRGLSLSGNKSAAGLWFGADGNEWTNLDIANYLVANFINWNPVTGVAGSVTWRIVGDTAALAAAVEEHNFDGMTPLQALKRLIDHRLGVGWRVITDGESAVYIHVYSTLPQPLMFGNVTVPANRSQGVMVFANDNMLSPEITINGLSDYDIIIGRGDHIRSMFSVSYEDGTLEEGWTEEEEEAYAAGSTAEGAGADEHDNERNTDRFRNVYQLHRVPSDWNYQAGDGEGGTQNLISPTVNWLGAVYSGGAANNFRVGQEFLSKLLVEVEGTNEIEPEYRKPFAVAKISTDGGGEVWVYVDKLDAFKLPEASIEMASNELAFRVHGRPVPHVAAKGHYDLLDPAPEESGTEPGWDYSTLIATVALRTDKRLFVVGTVPNRAVREMPRIKMVEDPAATAWYIAPGTVLDVENGALVKHAGGVLRDDSYRLLVLVARAMAWYGVPRSTISVEVGCLTLAWPVGSMVSGVLGPEGFTDVHTVVSRQVWQFTDEGAKTVIETGFLELDFVQQERN